MKTAKLASLLGLETFCLPDPEREVTGGYAGDLLSWVMGRAESGDAWVTIMSNINIVAVASLADTACVILAEGVIPDEGVTAKAEDRGINLLGSRTPTFALCTAIAKALEA